MRIKQMQGRPLRTFRVKRTKWTMEYPKLSSLFMIILWTWDHKYSEVKNIFDGNESRLTFRA